MQTTKNGRILLIYCARFGTRDTFERAVVKRVNIKAVNDFQAEKKAAGIAAKNGWTFVSVGRK